MVNSSFQGSTIYIVKNNYEIREKIFPNLFVLLKITCIFPITSAECERSFSALRRLRNWLRTNMKMERLGSVAIMEIHWQEEVDYKHASKLFSQIHSGVINYFCFYMFLFVLNIIVV